jgi:hypothetical protein
MISFVIPHLLVEGHIFCTKGYKQLDAPLLPNPKPPNNYDVASDTNPTAITITGNTETTIKANPVQ